MKRIYGVFAISILAVACGGKEPPPLAPSKTGTTEAQVRGSVVPAVAELHKLHEEGYTNGCDKEFMVLQSEIAVQLDQRADAIRAIDEKILPKNYRVIDLGPAKILERLPQEAEKGWKEKSYGWDNIREQYAKIKNEPTNENWWELNGRFRNLVLRDSYRLDGKSFTLDKDSGPKILRALEQVRACVQDEKCMQPNLDEESRQFLERVPEYEVFLGAITSSELDSERRPRISYLNAKLERDRYNYLLEKSPAVAKSGAQEITVTMDPGVFAPAKDQLAKMIEDVWSSPELVVKVSWKTRDGDNPRLFQFLFHQEVGGTAYVSYGDNSVNLFPMETNKAIAHEVGHVMGFPDRYYYLWESKICGYRTQANHDDLMSNHEPGGILPSTRDELRKVYFFE